MDYSYIVIRTYTYGAGRPPGPGDLAGDEKAE